MPSNAFGATIMLRLGTLMSATAFAAIAIYIGMVEQPARLLLEPQAALTQWAAGFPTAMKIQGGLALLCTALAGWLWYRTRNWLWLIGAAAAIANWPFTLVWLAPINDTLLATPSSQAGDATRTLLVNWGQFHTVRTALVVAAAIILALAVLRDESRGLRHAR
jgi:hypothetical protein